MVPVPDAAQLKYSPPGHPGARTSGSCTACITMLPSAKRAAAAHLNHVGPLRNPLDVPASGLSLPARALEAPPPKGYSPDIPHRIVLLDQLPYRGARCLLAPLPPRPRGEQGAIAAGSSTSSSLARTTASARKPSAPTPSAPTPLPHLRRHRRLIPAAA